MAGKSPSFKATLPREAAKKEKAKAPTADDDDLDALLMEFSTQAGQHLAANSLLTVLRKPLGNSFGCLSCVFYVAKTETEILKL